MGLGGLEGSAQAWFGRENHHLLSFRQWRSDLQECLPKQSASGDKGDAWEGGFRVPFALQWKGRLPQGAVYQKPVSALDLGGTVVALSGAEVPEGKPLDGVNLIPYLTGENKGAPHEAIYLRQFDRNRFAVRQGNEKILIPWKGERLNSTISERILANQPTWPIAFRIRSSI